MGWTEGKDMGRTDRHRWTEGWTKGWTEEQKATLMDRTKGRTWDGQTDRNPH